MVLGGGDRRGADSEWIEHVPPTDDLAARVRRLEEVDAARGHVAAYAAVLDVADPDRVAGLFAEDGRLCTRRGQNVGREAIADFYRQRSAEDASVKRHFIANTRLVWLRPGLVGAASHFLFTAQGSDSVLGWGTYRDEVRVDGTRCEFTSKTIVLEVATTLGRGWAANLG
ncbi:MAG: nuclear transport factor 2 family protein [Actinomycetales bacterium]